MRRAIVVLGCLGCAASDAPEPAPDAPPPFEEVGAVPAGCVDGRADADRPDDTARDQIRVLYVVPADGPDFQHDTDGRICNSIRAVATWFHAQTGAYLRFDTQDGLLDIGFARLAIDDATMRGNDPSNATIDTGIAFVRERIERALPPIRSNKLYAVFYEGTSSYSCGGGAWPPTVAGRLGAMYLRAQPPGEPVACGDSRPWGQDNLVPSYVDYGILHELVHSLGFVRLGAPNEHTSGHVYDLADPDPPLDLMYSQRPGMPDRPWGIDDPRGLTLDLGHDDYFGDITTSSLVVPLPANAQRPPGW